MSCFSSARRILLAPKSSVRAVDFERGKSLQLVDDVRSPQLHGAP